jgi:hypothetical protein
VFYFLEFKPKIMKKILIMAILLLSVNNVVSQTTNYFGADIDLTEMSEQQRDSLLLARAKFALFAGSDERYYNIEHLPVIKYEVYSTFSEYCVYYLYNPDIELFDEHFSARVAFEATTGRALRVKLGTGWAFGSSMDNDGLNMEWWLNSSEKFGYQPWWSIGEPETDYVIERRKEIKKQQTKLLNDGKIPFEDDTPSIRGGLTRP